MLTSPLPFLSRQGAEGGCAEERHRRELVEQLCQEGIEARRVLSCVLTPELAAAQREVAQANRQVGKKRRGRVNELRLLSSTCAPGAGVDASSPLADGRLGSDVDKLVDKVEHFFDFCKEVLPDDLRQECQRCKTSYEFAVWFNSLEDLPRELPCRKSLVPIEIGADDPRGLPEGSLGLGIRLDPGQPALKKGHILGIYSSVIFPGNPVEDGDLCRAFEQRKAQLPSAFKKSFIEEVRSWPANEHPVFLEQATDFSDEGQSRPPELTEAGLQLAACHYARKLESYVADGNVLVHNVDGSALSTVANDGQSSVARIMQHLQGNYRGLNEDNQSLLLTASALGFGNLTALANDPNVIHSAGDRDAGAAPGDKLARATAKAEVVQLLVHGWPFLFMVLNEDVDAVHVPTVLEITYCYEKGFWDLQQQWYKRCEETRARAVAEYNTKQESLRDKHMRKFLEERVRRIKQEAPSQPPPAQPSAAAAGAPLDEQPVAAHLGVRIKPDPDAAEPPPLGPLPPNLAALLQRSAAQQRRPTPAALAPVKAEDGAAAPSSSLAALLRCADDALPAAALGLQAPAFERRNSTTSSSMPAASRISRPPPVRTKRPAGQDLVNPRGPQRSTTSSSSAGLAAWGIHEPALPPPPPGLPPPPPLSGAALGYAAAAVPGYAAAAAPGYAAAAAPGYAAAAAPSSAQHAAVSAPLLLRNLVACARRVLALKHEQTPPSQRTALRHTAALHLDALELVQEALVAQAASIADVFEFKLNFVEEGLAPRQQPLFCTASNSQWEFEVVYESVDRVARLRLAPLTNHMPGLAHAQGGQGLEAIDLECAISHYDLRKEMTVSDPPHSHKLQVERVAAVMRDIFALLVGGELPACAVLRGNRQDLQVKQDVQQMRAVVKRATLAATDAAADDVLSSLSIGDFEIGKLVPVYALYLLHEDSWLAQLEAKFPQHVWRGGALHFSDRSLDASEPWKRLVTPLVPAPSCLGHMPPVSAWLERSVLHSVLPPARNGVMAIGAAAAAGPEPRCRGVYVKTPHAMDRELLRLASLDVEAQPRVFEPLGLMACGFTVEVDDGRVIAVDGGKLWHAVRNDRDDPRNRARARVCWAWDVDLLVIVLFREYAVLLLRHLMARHRQGGTASAVPDSAFNVFTRDAETGRLLGAGDAANALQHYLRLLVAGSSGGKYVPLQERVQAVDGCYPPATLKSGEWANKLEAAARCDPSRLDLSSGKDGPLRVLRMEFRCFGGVGPTADWRVAAAILLFQRVERQLQRILEDALGLPRDEVRTLTAQVAADCGLGAGLLPPKKEEGGHRAVQPPRYQRAAPPPGPSKGFGWQGAGPPAARAPPRRAPARHEDLNPDEDDLYRV